SEQGGKAVDYGRRMSDRSLRHISHTLPRKPGGRQGSSCREPCAGCAVARGVRAAVLALVHPAASARIASLLGRQDGGRASAPTRSGAGSALAKRYKALQMSAARQERRLVVQGGHDEATAAA